MKITVDNEIKNTDYKKSIKEVKNFLKTYNEILMSKVHKTFWPDFYLNHKNRFKIDIIQSSLEQTLICIEKTGEKEDLLNISFTNKNPQLFVQEQRNNIIFTQKQFEPFFRTTENAYCVLLGANGSFEGSPLFFDAPSGSFIVFLNINIRVEGPTKGKFITTNFPGVNFIIGATKIENFEDSFIKAANDIFNYQLQEYYVESELFRKALIHPKFKNMASEIMQRRAEANNKVKEYPQWEFERDTNKMRAIAKENNFSENYVDEIIKDPQYYPISGVLLFYYSNKKAFMFQWCLINIILFISICILNYLELLDKATLRAVLLTVLLTINGWIYKKKSEMVSMEYWILPFIELVASLFILYIHQIIKAIS